MFFERPSFSSVRNYLVSMLPTLGPTLRLDEYCRRSFLRDLDLFRLALDRRDRIDETTGVHGMELKARWEWCVFSNLLFFSKCQKFFQRFLEQRTLYLVQKALEIGLPVSCVVVGALDYEILLKNDVSPSELFELDDLVREPSFCPFSYKDGKITIDESDRTLVEVYRDFGKEVGNEIVRALEYLKEKGFSRRAMTMPIDPRTTAELTPLQVLAVCTFLIPTLFVFFVTCLFCRACRV